MKDWGKFQTTEWITFLLIYVTSTVALFTHFTGFEAWGGVVVGAAINLGVVRWHKKKTILQKENGTLPPLDGSKP